VGASRTHRPVAMRVGVIVSARRAGPDADTLRVHRGITTVIWCQRTTWT
jgi:hypothetical protein